MTPQELRDRTRKYALEIVGLAPPMFDVAAARDAAGQLLRSSMSVAANYRSACVARSHAEFRAKIGLALEECDGSVFWLELLSELHAPGHERLAHLIQEGRELTKILGASKRTSAHRARLSKARRRRRPQ